MISKRDRILNKSVEKPHRDYLSQISKNVNIKNLNKNQTSQSIE